MLKMGAFLDGYLNSPIAGIAPWVLFSVLSSPGRFEVAVCSALGLSVLTLWIGLNRGVAVYALDALSVAFFAVLAVIGLVASDGVIAFLELWAGELTNIVLAVFVIGTILVRRPFTLAYAKKQAPEEYWDTPLFKKINYMISGVWAAAFVFSAVVGLIGDAILKDPNNFWTGWVLQLGALFFAIAYTEFYPDYATAHDADAGGDEPAPSLLKLFDWLPTFILIAGIFGWVTDALPDTIGIGIIVVGIAGAALVKKFVPAEESTPMSKLSVIYYSATGHGTTMAHRIAQAAEGAGAEVRVRHVAETRDPETFAHNPAWTANYEATKDLPAATGDDIVWADAVIFGSPTRFGSPASQFRNFIDTLGGLWAQGKLADKVYAGFTSSQTEHGGQETTLLALYISLMHFGGIIVPPGYTDALKFADGNPYGVSHVTGPENKNEISEATNAALDHLAKRVVTVSDRLTGSAAGTA